MRGPSTRQEFANELREARHRSGLSLRALAKQVGLSASTVQGWFEGKHLPTLALQDQFLELAAILDLTTQVSEEEWLLTLGRLRSMGQVGANPYLGMQSYGPEDADRFFGRRKLLDELVAAVLATETSPDAKLVAVVGVSGSGKSSLLQAGLLGLECAAGGRLAAFTCAQVAPQDLAGWAPPSEGPVLLVVDHLESLRSLGTPATEEALGALASLPSNVVCVFGLAAHAFDLAASDSRLRRALTSPVLVGTLKEEEFEDIIREPAQISGRPVDDALVTLIIKALWRYGEPPASVLPMLSNSLRQSWAQAQGGTVAVDDYLATGGIWGSLERLAEGIYSAATPAQQLHIRELFLELVQVTAEGIERRSVDVGTLSDDAVAAADEFLNARLLTLEGNQLSVGHSALLGRWKRLGAWSEEEREQLLFRRRITKAAEVWEESKRDPHALIPVEALVFDEFARTSDIALTPLEADFFEASVARAERESEQQRHEIGRLRRRNVMITVLALIATVGLVLATVMMGRAENFRMSAEAAQREAQSRQMALIAEEMRATDRNLAAQLSLAAHRTSNTLEAQAAVLKSAGLRAPLRRLGAPGTVRLASSLDGKLLLRSSSGGLVEGWRDGELGEPAFTFQASQGQLFGLGHGHHAGRDFVAVAGQGTASLWDVTGEPRLLGEFGADTVGYSAAIAGGTAHFGMVDGSIQRINLDTSKPLPAIVTDMNAPVDGLSARADGTVVAAGVEQLLGWRSDGTPLPPEPVQRRVTRIQFAPDGRSIAATGAGGRAWVYDVTDQGFSHRTDIEFGAVTLHALQYDGNRIFVGAWDGEVGAFSPSGQPLGSFFEPSTVTGLALLGQHVVTGTIDGALRVWPPEYSGMLVEGSATSLPTALYEDHIVKYFDGYAGLYHVDGSPEHRLEFTEDADTGLGPVLISDHVITLPTVSGRLATWDVEHAPSRTPVFSQIGTANAYTLDSGPENLAVYAELAKDSVMVIRRTGLTWEPVAQVPTWSTLAMGWHPTKPWLAAMSVDSERLLIHDLSSGEPILLGEVEVPRQGAAIRLHWAPDGGRVYLGTDGGLVFGVDVSADGVPALSEAQTHVSAGVSSIAVSADGSQVAAGLLDGRINVWNVGEGGLTPEASLRPGRGAVAGVQFHEDNVVFVTDTEGIYSWPLDVAVAVESLCAGVGDPLTAEEWERMVPGVEPVDGCAA